MILCHLFFFGLGFMICAVCQDENRSEFTHPELPSEDSMFAHLSFTEQETLHTQVLVDTHT